MKLAKSLAKIELCHATNRAAEIKTVNTSYMDYKQVGLNLHVHVDEYVDSAHK